MSEDDKDVLQIQILSIIKDHSSISSLDLATTIDITHDRLVGLIKSLESRNKLILSEPKEQACWTLSPEGLLYSNLGSPEARFFELVKTAGKPVPLADLTSGSAKSEGYSDDVIKIGMKTAMKLNWISLDKATKTLFCAVENVQDICRNTLVLIGQNSNAVEEKLTKIIGGEDPTKLLNVSE